MSRSAQEMGTIPRSGGGLEFDGSTYSTNDLAMIARQLDSGARLKLTNMGGRSTNDLALIARSGEGAVTFVL